MTENKRRVLTPEEQNAIDIASRRKNTYGFGDTEHQKLISPEAQEILDAALKVVVDHGETKLIRRAMKSYLKDGKLSRAQRQHVMRHIYHLSTDDDLEEKAED